MTQKQQESYISKNYHKKPVKELAEHIGKSESQVRRIARAMGIPPKAGGGQNKIDYTQVPVETLKETVFEHILKSKKHLSYEQLSDKFDVGISKIKSVIEELKKENKNFNFIEGSVGLAETIDKSEPTVISSKHLVGKRIRFGFVTDTHLGSKYERLDVLNAVYERFQMAGITDVYHAGNAIDGEARFNKFDIHKYGVQAQCEYFAQAYPQVAGLTTHFITGDKMVVS